MTDQKDDLADKEVNARVALTIQRDAIADARVALAIKHAAVLLDGSWNYWNSVAYDKRQAGLSDNQAIHAANETQRLKAAILALPHNPEALEAYVRGKVDEALEGTFRNGEEVAINGKTYVRRMILFEKGEFHPDYNNAQ